MDSQDLKSGRSQFLHEEGKRDYSGEDFESIYFGMSPSLNYSYFNGIQAIDCAFDSTDISNVEMAESYIHNCYMNNVNISGTDFVGSRFNNVKFVNCTFLGGEWRDTLFTECTFKNCDLTHTTINLCVFEFCEFCPESSAHLEQLSINYNTFLRSEITRTIENDVVLSRNFALPSAQKGRALASKGQGITLEHVCLASAYGDFNIESLATAVERELLDSNQRRMRKLRFEFITNIISQLATQRMISAASLVYIEGMFTYFAKTVHENADLSIAMSALMAIRNAIYEATQIEDELTDNLANCPSLEVAYETDLDEDDANNLAHLLTCAIAIDGVKVRLQSVRKGSVIMDYIITGAVQVSAVLFAVNFALAQATKTFSRISELKESVITVASPPQPRRQQHRIRDKLPALERNGGLATEMEPARKAVQQIGIRITRLDRAAKVRIDLDQ
ncbi:MAG: pentapeptide repeat-containing protein [Alphaproteobacteria bacterium]|nr:pentapeptide repeat-containing protein [Alphaproteobacteria bacterium]MBF0247551.1 pentapeptide repeat-containing protein [Alphaproteobacteria bacterium]